MAGTFEDEVKAEIEALREFSQRQEQRRADEERRRLQEETSGGLDRLGLPELRSVIADRFENARLRNRLAEAERRIAELEQAIGRT